VDIVDKGTSPVNGLVSEACVDFSPRRKNYKAPEGLGFAVLVAVPGVT
jgi:hypothetical protein